MSGLDRVKKGLNQIRDDDWNNHGLRARIINEAAEKAVQTARERWEADVNAQVRERVATAFYDLRNEHGVEFPEGIDPVRIAMGLPAKEIEEETE